MYYVQHVFAAVLAPLVLFCAGRYRASDSLVYPLPILGFIFFTLYMRFFLTPMSSMTWANLNHTLCGIDNDPWRVTFGMHKYFYIWADGYLLLTSSVVSIINASIGKLICGGRNELPKEIKTRRD
jgi:hypothetical protein